MSNLPLAIMGNFNYILSNDENKGRTPHPPWLIQGFKDTISRCGLKDLAFENHQFTWERGRGTPAWVYEKLDRILVNDAWLDLFEEAKATSFEATSSDHLPLILLPKLSIKVKVIKRFKFENLWVHED